MDKNNLGHLKNLLQSTKGDLENLEEKLEKGHKELRKITQKTEDKYNNQLKQVNATPQTKKSVDTYLKGLKILIDEEDKKKNIAISSINSAKETIDSVIGKIEDANKLTTKKEQEQRNQIIQEITSAIPSLIEFIQSVFDNSNYLVSRANANAYVLHKQEILRNQGIQFEEKQYYLQGIQSAVGDPRNATSLSSQINFFKTNVGKSGNILVTQQSKGFSFTQQNLEAKQKKDKEAADDAALRERFPNIQEKELPKAANAAIKFIRAQRLKIKSGEQTDSEIAMRKKIEDTFGVLAPDIIKYAAPGNKKQNRISGKELYQQIKKTRGFGDRPEIESIGDEMIARFLQARNAKFNNPSALKNVPLEQALGAESPIADVKLDADPVVNTSPITDVKLDAEDLSSSGDGGGSGKSKRRITIGRGSKGGSSSGGGTGSSSPIHVSPGTQKGKTSSPGEVSDEMLKIIEQAVFDGAARAFSQFSNSPISGPSEFSDSTIDKIGNTVYEAMKKALDYYSASPALHVVLYGIDPSVIKLLKDELGSISGGGTGDMDKLAEELRKSRESNENLAKMQEARRKKAQSEANKKKKEAEKERKRKEDPNSPESLAKKKKEADAAERERKRKEKEDPNSPTNLAKAAEKEEKRKKKEEDDKKKQLKLDRESDPFRKRLKTIFKEGEQELTYLYAKTDAFVGWIPGFNDAILNARKKALETLREGYEAFDEKYADSGSAFKGMWASLQKMYSISPFTVIAAGLTTAFIGILSAATRLNSRIKEISAELGTSNMQSYELFKNAMNAQTQYDNMYASLRDVRDVQKGILGDSGILLQTNDKALASVADNAKNIGLSVESAGAFYENLRMKGGSDKEASNLMAASLELADKKGFSPQSIVDDIAQNAEFASKYFSNINKHSKSAHRNLIETNLQVKALGLNFQKAAKMTQHLLSFEQSIVAEVEASVALGRHVNIGKARELLLQDDIAGAMTQMMDTMGGYDEFQNMDFAKRQLMANAIGMEVSELEKSLYLREKIGLKDAESLDAAMKNSDYLDKVAGKDVELYKIETKKVMAAERFNTAIEKVSVAFKSSLLPILEAIVPIVDHIAWAINLVAGTVKFLAGLPGKLVGLFPGVQTKQDGTSNAPGLDASMALGMTAVMGGLLLKTIRGKIGGKIGEAVGKARGGLDAVTGTLGSKSNPMYVQVVGGIGGVGGIGEILDSTSRGGRKGGRAGFLKRLSTSREVLDRAKSIQKIRDARLSTSKTGSFAKIGQLLSKIKLPSLPKIGGLLAVVGAVGEVVSRKSKGQSNTQAFGATAAGAGGALLGAKGGALAGASLGGIIGTAVPVIGNAIGAAVGGVIGGLAGGFAGYYGGASLVDSQFNKKPSSSYQTQPFQYQGMGLSATGSIYGGVNKPKATGTPVETSMVDMTPTTFKTTSTGLSGITPNYGTTSMARESVMVNTVSKSLEATALMNSIKEKNIEKEKAHKELMQQQLKILESIREKINQPAVAFFTDEGRRQVINHSRVKNSH